MFFKKRFSRYLNVNFRFQYINFSGLTKFSQNRLNTFKTAEKLFKLFQSIKLFIFTHFTIRKLFAWVGWDKFNVCDHKKGFYHIIEAEVLGGWVNYSEYAACVIFRHRFHQGNERAKVQNYLKLFIKIWVKLHQTQHVLNFRRHEISFRENIEVLRPQLKAWLQ